jgi:hypothetical protein
VPPLARAPALTVIAGFAGPAKARAIRAWLAGRPGGERWALLANDPADGLQAEFPGAVRPLAAGCACCIGGAPLPATIGRLLRDGPWDRVLLDLAGEGRPAALLDRLRGAVLGSALRVDGVVLVVDGAKPAPWLDPAHAGHPLATAQLAASDLVLLEAPAGAAAGTLRETLEASPFGRRAVLVAAPASPPAWAEVRAGLGAALAPPTGDPIPGGGLRQIERTQVRWWWPASAGFDRGALQRGVAAVAAAGAPLAARGVFPTERDWYLLDWRGDRAEWAPTDWRRDARLEAQFGSAADPGALEAVVLGALRRPSG